METLLAFFTFDFEADKAGKKWCTCLTNLPTWLNITDNDRKRTLLLHYAGERVYDIYVTSHEILGPNEVPGRN